MKTTLYRIIPILLFGLLLAACSGDDTAAPKAVDLIPLPNGFQPEGIAISGNSIYAGSIPSGAVYRADITSGTGSVLVPAQAGRAAIGIKLDGRGRIFVAGGATGKAFLYDAASGQDLAVYTLTPANTVEIPTFVNDVVLTADAAWFTDSRKPVLYRVPLPADGSLAGQETVTTLSLSGDLLLVAGVNNLNGIASAGSRLIVVQSNTGFLFSVDPLSGVTRKIDIGAETVVNGDGLLLEGQTLFVVQNRLNLVAVIDLAPDFNSGTLRTRFSNPAFDVPTTIAGAASGLYVVNARFGVTVTPDTPYSVVRFDRP
ncbi:MAG: superoxide dismutase [Steroidobacteraceae bacterium]|nr:superoxide dismutase [Deltaproteobacteria bacterium]